MNKQTIAQPLTKLNIFSAKGIQMRTFHITWLAFFFCFFAWFGIAPLMPLVKKQLGLTKSQIGNIQIASVSATIIARLIVGRLVDKFGPRLIYTWLLALCSIPVMCIGLSDSYGSFLLMRLAIGLIGASFVITQFHTSVMFAPNIKGTANATAGGFGNAGGGATNFFMPLIAAGLVGAGLVSTENSWRVAMIVPGVMLLVMAYLYWKKTKDLPQGNYADVIRPEEEKGNTFMIALKDYRTWILTIAYAACFGVEITVDNFAALHFHDKFSANLALAGILASIFGWINIFARPLGGIVADKIGLRYGFNGKTLLLSVLLLLEGAGIILFAASGMLLPAIVMMFFFGLSLKMANGATYSLVPFVNPKAVGSVAGIVGAGGNVGAMLIGFLFKYQSVQVTKDIIDYTPAFKILGFIVLGVGVIIFVFRQVTKGKSEMITVNKNIRGQKITKELEVKDVVVEDIEA